MILSDQDIRWALYHKWIKIDPEPPDDCIQPASVDLHLGDTILIGHPFNLGFTEIDIRAPGLGAYLLQPGQFVLGTTVEKVTLDSGHVGQLNGKSTLGRQGLLIHATAGFVDPGFSGQLTLEMYNLRQNTIRLEAGQKIAQICFIKLSSGAFRPYGHPELGSHYQGQEGPRGPYDG